jgi:hypothetical protein
MTERRITSDSPSGWRGGLWAQDVLAAALITVVAVVLISVTWSHSGPNHASHVDASIEAPDKKR